MRRLTAILLLLPVTLALLAPTAMFAGTKACCEHRAAGHNCPHPQDSQPQSPSEKQDCHRCCATMVAGVAPTAPRLGIALIHREFLAVAPPAMAPAAPITAVIFERGPPSA
ncbi:MAG: hypothetical protein ACRD2Y_03045 [Terriglobales bacterium]